MGKMECLEEGGKDSKPPREGIFIHSRTETSGGHINGIKSVLKIILKMCFEQLGCLNKIAKNYREL